MLKKRNKGIQYGGNARKKRTRFFVGALLIIFIIAIYATLAALILRSTFMQISSVEIAGAKTISVEDIHSVAESDLSSAWWGLFSKNNFLLYPKKTIANDLMAKYPTLSDVSFSMQGLHTLRVSVTERTPYALGCDDTQPDHCFYIDSSGIVFAEAPQFSNGVYVKYYVASSSVSLSTVFTGPDRLSFLKYVTDFVTKTGLHVYGATILPGNDYIVYIQNPKIAVYMNDLASKERTMTYFNAFWSNQKNKNFIYIDLRFDKDIIYKE
jgi:hypothetical protein